ncbi:hypothetical protein [Rhodovibrio salinarum]|uniref:hypothetical protein n=1 Tax=Rhodovibrio salinarum TaxID=1087 RepID=UPI0012DE0749|nr:hypothetical protein [Rhodovibrio salinarum]
MKYSYESVFTLDSPFDLIRKLENEVCRIKDADKLNELIEHVLNFALTANHIPEWIWAKIEMEPHSPGDKFERDVWLTDLGGKPENFASLRRNITSSCPGMELCRQISNCSKHMSTSVHNHHDGFKRFNVIRTSKYEETLAKRPFVAVLEHDKAENFRLVAESGSRQLDVVKILCEEVFPYWSEKGYRLYIGV